MTPESDFIVLGCDGIFDYMTSQEVLDVMWDVINKQMASGEAQKDIHSLTALMVDAVLHHAAIKGSIDNLTLIVVCSKGFK